MASTRGDHDLLFEALAIHLGFVARSAVDEARKVAAADDSTTISFVEVLSHRAGLTAERAAVLETLANDLLSRHGGNLRQCLNSLTAFGRLRHDLERRLAGLESKHPTVPPVAGLDKAPANPEVRPPTVRPHPVWRRLEHRSTMLGLILTMKQMPMATAMMPIWTRRSMSGV